jgi:Ran GTPase-activating protein (RanGAP) involved in mRNA processing and transport
MILVMVVSLKHCHSLQTLDIWGNDISDDGAKALAEGLQHCNRLLS